MNIADKLSRILSKHATGKEYKERYYLYPWKITTKLRPLDEILEGGLYPYKTYLLYGEAGVGKSQLAMYMAAAGALTGKSLNREKVIYIDTEGSFSSSRLLVFLNQLMERLNIELGYKNKLSSLLKSILVGQPRTIDSLLSLLDKSSLLMHETILLIIDNIANPLLAIKNRSPNVLFKALRNILNRLVALLEYPISIVLTSRVYSVPAPPLTSMLQPYGGITLGGFIDCELFLFREHNNIRIINVYDNRVAYIRITSEGFVEG